jgi:cell division protein ZapA
MNVRINIRGRQYTVRGEESQEEIQAVANDLDRRLAEVASRTRSFDEYTIALLTALNLASELQRLKQQLSKHLSDVDRDVASIAAILESAIPEESAGS